MDPRDYEREEERKEEYENRQQRYDQYQPSPSSQPPKRRLFPVIASSIAGAVLGGGIVLYGAPQLGLMDSADTQTANQTSNNTYSNRNNNEYNASNSKHNRESVRSCFSCK
nr:hypothetical protein [Priestia aryabhattai]